jgi:hypothetical protein
MEIEGSFTRSKEAVTYHCPEPAQSALYNLGTTSPLVNIIVTMKKSHIKTSPYSSSYFVKNTFNIILESTPRYLKGRILIGISY